MLNKVCIDTKVLDILTGSELKLFMIVNSYDEGLGSYVSTKRISKDHNINIRNVQRTRKQLVEKGYLHLVYMKGHTYWEWNFENVKKDANDKNVVICSSSFKYKNTTTTYSDKNVAHLSESTMNNEISINDKNVAYAKNGKEEVLAENCKTTEPIFDNVNKLIHISKRVFEKAMRKYPIDEIKKAVVYTYRKNPQKPESYFLMTLAKEWALDVTSDDLEKEIARIERENERKVRSENKRMSMLEKIRIEEETNKRQFELEIARRKMIEEGLMKGKISFDTDVMNEFSRARFEDAMKKGDYKRAAVHLMPYLQVKYDNDTAVVV